MTKVTMKAVDSMHISSVKADNLVAGEEFDIAEVWAADLEKRGMATRVLVKADKTPVKNKAEGAAPSNKKDKKALASLAAPVEPVALVAD